MWAAVKFIKSWLPSHLSSESRDPSYVGLAMCAQCPRKYWPGTCCWLHPRESGLSVVQGPGGVTTSPNLLVSSWCGPSRTTWYCCWSWDISGSSRAFVPANLRREKAGIKMNEYWGLHYIMFLEVGKLSQWYYVLLFESSLYHVLNRWTPISTCFTTGVSTTSFSQQVTTCCHFCRSWQITLIVPQAQWQQCVKIFIYNFLQIYPSLTSSSNIPLRIFHSRFNSQASFYKIFSLLSV